MQETTISLLPAVLGYVWLLPSEIRSPLLFGHLPTKTREQIRDAKEQAINELNRRKAKARELEVEAMIHRLSGAATQAWLMRLKSGPQIVKELIDAYARTLREAGLLTERNLKLTSEDILSTPEFSALGSQVQERIAVYAEEAQSTREAHPKIRSLREWQTVLFPAFLRLKEGKTWEEMASALAEVSAGGRSPDASTLSRWKEDGRPSSRYVELLVKCLTEHDLIKRRP